MRDSVRAGRLPLLEGMKAPGDYGVSLSFNGAPSESVYKLAASEGHAGGYLFRAKKHFASGGDALVYHLHFQSTEEAALKPKGKLGDITQPQWVLKAKQEMSISADDAAQMQQGAEAARLLGIEAHTLYAPVTGERDQHSLVVECAGDVDLERVRAGQQVSHDSTRENVQKLARLTAEVRYTLLYQLMDQYNQLAEAGLKYTDIKPANVRIGFDPPSAVLVDLDSVVSSNKRVENVTPDCTVSLDGGYQDPGATRHGFAAIMQVLFPEEISEVLVPHVTPDGFDAGSNVRAFVCKDAKSQLATVLDHFNLTQVEGSESKRSVSVARSRYAYTNRRETRIVTAAMDLVVDQARIRIQERDLDADINSLLRFLSTHTLRLEGTPAKKGTAVDHPKTRELVRLFGEVRTLKAALLRAQTSDCPERAREVTAIQGELALTVAAVGVASMHARVLKVNRGARAAWRSLARFKTTAVEAVRQQTFGEDKSATLCVKRLDGSVVNSAVDFESYQAVIGHTHHTDDASSTAAGDSDGRTPSPRSDAFPAGGAGRGLR